MTSVERRFFNLMAHQRPIVGDTKTSAIGIDHMGWLICDGRALLISEFPQLYNVIGRSFGSNTSADFLLPAPAGRVPGFVGSGTGLTPRTLGDAVGTETHTLTINEMPAHTHGSVDVSGNTNGNGITDLSGAHTHSGTTDSAGYAASSHQVFGTGNNSADDTGSHTHTFTTGEPSVLHHHTIGSTGGGQEHNNMQPTLFVGNLFMYCGRPFYGSNAITPTMPYTSGIYVQSTAAPGSNLA